jgi:hypothetical protein
VQGWAKSQLQNSDGAEMQPCATQRRGIRFLDMSRGTSSDGLIYMFEALYGNQDLVLCLGHLKAYLRGLEARKRNFLSIDGPVPWTSTHTRAVAQLILRGRLGRFDRW